MFYLPPPLIYSQHPLFVFAYPLFKLHMPIYFSKINLRTLLWIWLDVFNLVKNSFWCIYGLRNHLDPVRHAYMKTWHIFRCEILLFHPQCECICYHVSAFLNIMMALKIHPSAGQVPQLSSWRQKSRKSWNGDLLNVEN